MSGPVTDVLITGNYLENIGDTGIDITGTKDVSPHQRITASGNTLVNAHVRVSNAENISIVGNSMQGWGMIDVDNGAGNPTNIVVSNNVVITTNNVGVGFYGCRDCQLTNNEISLTGSGSGVHAVIRGVGLIEGNTIVGGDYGSASQAGDWAENNS